MRNNSGFSSNETPKIKVSLFVLFVLSINQY